MSNRLRGYVPFPIGDEEYMLRLGFTQVAAADSQIGSSSIQAAMQGRFDAILALLMAGLSNKRNPPKMAKVLRDALDNGEVAADECMTAIVEALKASGVIAEGGDGDDDGDQGEA